MNRNAVTSVLVAGLVLLAGCSGGLTGSPDGTATGESAMDGQTTAETIEGETGTLNMYISDEENAISDFEHLNVTITRIGVKPAGDDAGDDDSEDADAEESEDGDDSDTETADDGSNETDSDSTETATETTEPGETETETPDSDEVDDEESEDADDAESDDEADDEENGESEWVEYEVDNRTVDLTELQGANATKLSSFEVRNGTYDKVFVYVSDVNGTLKDGSDQRVKLPSGKLQLNSEFTVGDGEEVDFVFDITAVKAGNSGKYILKPVISESGTDVEIDRVDGEERDDADDEARDDEQPEADESELNASFVGNVTAGENATLSVTQDGEPVENASIWVDDERVGTTDSNGTYSLAIPDDAEEVEVKVTYEDAETEVDVELDGESEDAEETDAADGSDGATERLVVG